MSHLVAASFSSVALLSSSISMVNLSCLLVTTFSSLSYLSNSFSFLRVARYCFSRSSVSDNLFFSFCIFFGSSSCSIFFASYPQPFLTLFFSIWSSVCSKFLNEGRIKDSKWHFVSNSQNWLRACACLDHVIPPTQHFGIRFFVWVSHRQS